MKSNKQKTKEKKMTIDKAYIYKRKDGETICYGELNEGDNIDITLDLN
jgi:transcription elongation factor